MAIRPEFLIKLLDHLAMALVYEKSLLILVVTCIISSYQAAGEGTYILMTCHG